MLHVNVMDVYLFVSLATFVDSSIIIYHLRACAIARKL